MGVNRKLKKEARGARADVRAGVHRAAWPDAPARASDFARRLLAEWRRLGLGGGRAVVAVSGGADSTALLLALDELTRAGRLDLRLTVAHLDHGLRGAAGGRDARAVEELAARLGHEAKVGRASVGRRASAARDNLEQAARRERYEFLAGAAREAGAALVVAAHTLDDQAETFLLALARGSGADGLGAMSPLRALDGGRPSVLLARPLLAWARRADTEKYCESRGVGWRADEMNEDERFARVRVRRRLLPLLETFNPRAAEALARAAALLREDSDALDAAAALLLQEATDEEAASSERGGKQAALSESGDKEAALSARCGKQAALSARSGEEAASSIRGGEEAASGDGRGVAPVRVEVVAPVRVEVLAGAAGALRRRALRIWLARGRGDLRRLELKHVAAVEKLLAGERGGRVAELPGGCSVERRKRWLFFRAEGAAAVGKAAGKNVEKAAEKNGKRGPRKSGEGGSRKSGSRKV